MAEGRRPTTEVTENRNLVLSFHATLIRSCNILLQMKAAAAQAVDISGSC